MRIVAAAAALCLVSCATALSQPASEPSEQRCAEGGTLSQSMCAWRAINANRAPGAFQGFYRAAAPSLDAELAIVEEGGDQVFVGVNYWVGGQACAARFEGRRVGEQLVLTPAPERATPGAACRVSLRRGESRDEIVFSMQQSCSSARHAPVNSEGDRFRIADPPHD